MSLDATPTHEEPADTNGPVRSAFSSVEPRPAAFTLLALTLFVLTFVLFNLVFAPATFREMGRHGVELPDEASRALIEAYLGLSETEVVVLSVLGGLCTVAALVAGIGLWSRHFVAGRIGSTVYALLVPIELWLPRMFLGEVPQDPARPFDPRPAMLLCHALVLLFVVHGPLRPHFRRRTVRD